MRHEKLVKSNKEKIFPKIFNLVIKIKFGKNAAILFDNH